MLTEDRIAFLLRPYLTLEERRMEPTSQLLSKIRIYVDLLLRWNKKTNLTAVRDEEEIVRRHFGEGLFAGLCLQRERPEVESLLDLGSGAGFPGIPLQLLYPDVPVVLGESQGKKAAFLREAVRELALPSEVWAARVETMPADRVFEVVTLRAVDRMEQMKRVASGRVRPRGLLLALSSGEMGDGLRWAIPQRSGSYVHLVGTEG